MTAPSRRAPRQHLAAIALLIDDYDAAIRYYTTVIGLELIEDTPSGPDKRWVLVAPPGACETRLLLARASGDAQRERIGDQAGGRVFLFLQTEDFDADHARLAARGVAFVDGPRREPWGQVALFADRYGNRWELIERHAAVPTAQAGDAATAGPGPGPGRGPVK